MTALRTLIAILLLAPCSWASDQVRVEVLGLFHPRQLWLEPMPRAGLRVSVGQRESTVRGRALRIAIAGREVEARSGSESIVAGELKTEGEFVLAVPGKLHRKFRGELLVSSHAGELHAVITMPLETAVASIVAAEWPTDAPLEALKAQAVVTRSYLVASGPRHRYADFCDSTHCQFLREPPHPDSPAARAAEATRGLVLAWRGRPFAAMYSQSCAGHTHSLADIGYAVRDYPYFAVECARCRQLAGVERGHGLGLCQRGARGMAEDGKDFRAILSHYFPNTTLQAAH